MHGKLTAAALSLVVLVSASCTINASKLNNVRIGMPKSEVLSVLGSPDSTSAQANIEYLTYYFSSDTSGRELPYMVRLVDAKVESFGRFVQLLDVYNRPVGSSQTLGMGAVMPNSMNTDVITQLQQLRSLQDQGVLTPLEVQRAKDRLLAERE